MEDLAAEDAFDDFLVDDDLLAEALPDESIETDEARQTRLKSIVDNCLNGKELFDYITTKLPVSGQKFGTSLSMNRALVYLKSVKLCDEASPTWASSKRVNKDNVAAVFSGIGANTPIFNTLKAAVLEGFHVKKEKNGAKKGHQVLILDEQEGPTINLGRPNSAPGLRTGRSRVAPDVYCHFSTNRDQLASCISGLGCSPCCIG